MIATLMTITLSTVMIAQTEPDWAALARGDIEGMHAATLENHPGVIDPENPGFGDTMAQAHARGLALADRVVDQAGYNRALEAYAASYRDGHYGVGSRPLTALPSWPGFIAARQAGIWRVRSADAVHAGLSGARIESCDGHALDDLMTENVFGFGGDPALEADWIRRAPALFLSGGNPFITAPQSCVFVIGETRIEQALDWQETSGADWSAQLAAVQERATFGLTEFAENRFWIGIPTFDPDDDQLAVMQDLIAELSTQAQTLQNAQAVVIDVRGNSGGSSAWGNAIVDAIWGTQYAAWRQPVDSEAVDYRISDGNIERVEDIVEILVEQNLPADEAEFRMVLAGMLEAREGGQGYYRHSYVSVVRPEPVSNPVSARVLFLTDGRCGSACLDFADELLALEGVTQIGGETYADSNYMEQRILDLPSGRSRMALPIKAYRGRPRDSGQAYTPTIAYPGEDWTTLALQNWVNDLIEGAD